MSGKTIYFTEKELEMISIHFDMGNVGFEDRENAEELYEIAESIRRKVSH